MAGRNPPSASLEDRGHEPSGSILPPVGGSPRARRRCRRGNTRGTGRDRASADPSRSEAERAVSTPLVIGIAAVEAQRKAAQRKQSTAPRERQPDTLKLSRVSSLGYREAPCSVTSRAAWRRWSHWFWGRHSSSSSSA